MIKTLESILRTEAGDGFFKRLPGEAKSAVGRNVRRGTKAAAVRSKRLIIKRLRRAQPNAIRNELLAILCACRKGRRCCHAACPVCTYAMQNLLTALMQDFRGVGIQLDTCMTLIPRLRILLSEAESPQGEDAIKIVEHLRAKLERAFDEAGVTLVFGSIDYDVNEFPQGQFKAHIKPHFHGTVRSSELTNSSDKIIRKNFKSGGSVNVPVLVEKFDGRDEWGRYMFKSPDRRKLRKQVAPKDRASTWLDSQYKPQTVAQHLQQLEILHLTGWKLRIFTRGLSLRRNRFDTWQLHVLHHTKN
ncbi:MAG: hypothetical protein HOO99_11810 [Hyphomicrobiaceae bacterium]|nr:hypothetical protein [Hyphomicrobiaceae bacterium]